jgi:hypothetical protein
MMLERALEFLYCLGALDDEGKLTKPLGVRMAEMPIDPMMSKIVSYTVLVRVQMLVLMLPCCTLGSCSTRTRSAVRTKS